MANQYTAVFEQDGDWWVASVEELPGALTQGRTLEEARENLKDAILLLLETNREQARQELDGRQVVREPIVIDAA